MKLAETVTFGGGNLDRAAHLRADAAALQDLAAQNGSGTILLWRGKVLIENGSLVHLPCDHPLLKCRERLFICRENDGGTFAVDISDWIPEEADLSQLNTFADSSLQSHPELPQTQAFSELRRAMVDLPRADAEKAATAKALFQWHKSHQFCAACGSASDMAMAGWQRNCPTCKTSHFPRTDPVVIMLITKGNNVLLGRSPGWPEGMYSLLAGFIEPGETLEAAVRREVFEESGIKVGAIRYLSSQPWPFPSSLMFGCAGEAENMDIDLDENELENALWLSREELARAFAGEHPEILPARKGSIAHFLLYHWLADQLD